MELLEIRELNVDFFGDNICYDKKNDGDKALLFIHGNNSSKKFWRHQVERLWLDNYKILSIDLLGYGNSDKPEFPYSFRLWAEIIERLRIIDDMNFTSPYLSTIQCSTLVIHGDRDELFTVEMYMSISIPTSGLFLILCTGLCGLTTTLK